MINLFADSYVVITPHLSGIEKCCVGGGNVMYRLMMRLCFVLDRILLNVVLSLLDARYVLCFVVCVHGRRFKLDSHGCSEFTSTPMSIPLEAFSPIPSLCLLRNESWHDPLGSSKRFACGFLGCCSGMGLAPALLFFCLARVLSVSLTLRISDLCVLNPVFTTSLRFFNINFCCY